MKYYAVKSGKKTGIFTTWAEAEKQVKLRLALEKIAELENVEVTEDEINEYISTDEPYDKAGAYGIQGAFAIYIKGIEGDYNNIVGLPIARLYQELKVL